MGTSMGWVTRVDGRWDETKPNDYDYLANAESAAASWRTLVVEEHSKLYRERPRVLRACTHTYIP